MSTLVKILINDDGEKRLSREILAPIGRAIRRSNAVVLR